VGVFKNMCEYGARCVFFFNKFEYYYDVSNILMQIEYHSQPTLWTCEFSFLCDFKKNTSLIRPSRKARSCPGRRGKRNQSNYQRDVKSSPFWNPSPFCDLSPCRIKKLTSLRPPFSDKSSGTLEKENFLRGRDLEHVRKEHFYSLNSVRQLRD